MSTMTTTTELGGIAEISEEFGVPRTTASQWLARRETNGFPEPLARLQMGPVFDMAAVREWASARVSPREMTPT
jgi:hypothetical protein